MHQALTRRYKRVRDGEIVAPDVLLIDGGKGQLAEAAQRCSRNSGSTDVTLIGVAKGPTGAPARSSCSCWAGRRPLYCRRTRAPCT
jgi:excinuclease ABC subunit C